MKEKPLTPLGFVFLKSILKGNNETRDIMLSLEDVGYEMSEPSFWQLVKRLVRGKYIVIEKNKYGRNVYHITAIGKNSFKETKTFYSE